MSIKQLEKASAAYYAGNPIITDEEFDAAISELRKNEPDNWFLKRVGAPVPGTLKVKHRIPMGSLSNVTNDKELKAWLSSNTQWGNNSICLSHKLDGSSLELVYKNGQFVQAITRGDGDIGEDVTRNVLLSQHFPMTIHPSITSVRCECLIHRDDWEQHFTGDANPRNSAAGTLRRHDGRNAKYLRFYAFDLLVDKSKASPSILSSIESECDILSLLSDCFDIPWYDWYKPLGTKDLYTTWCEPEEAQRNELPYEIDGIVAKIDDRQNSLKMGVVNGRPKGQVAVKFKPRGGETVLRNVIWQMGSTGALTPVGEVDPVGVGGTIIRRATLCNMDEIERLGIAIGDTVEVIRACDVIPKLSKMIKEGSDRKTIEPPSACPSCCSALTKNGAHIRCRNNECTLKSYQRVMNWVNKRNILNIGIKLIIAAKIKTISQLYGTSESEWEDVRISSRLFGAKRAKKVVDALEKSKTVSLPEFLGSLGIKGVGRSLASDLCEYFSGLPDSQLTLRDILQLHPHLIARQEKFGDVRASDFCDWLQRNREEVSNLARIMNIQYETNDEKGVFDGETICFTGKAPKPRSELSRLAEAAGASVCSSVSNKTTILVIDDIESTTSKAVKARKLGIKLMPVQDFMTYLHG